MGKECCSYLMRLAAKKFIGREITERLGQGRQTADNMRLFLCPNHKSETVSGKQTSFDTLDKSGVPKIVTFTMSPFLAPKTAGKGQKRIKGVWS